MSNTKQKLMTMADVHLRAFEEFGLNLKVYDPPHDYIYYVERAPAAAIFFERDAIPEGVALFNWDTNTFEPCTPEIFGAKMTTWFGAKKGSRTP